jgi:2-haloacid dehalogenase
VTTVADTYDAVVFDILGTMVDQPGGIQAGIRALLPDLEAAEVRRLGEVWDTYVDDEQSSMLAGDRRFATSSTLSLEAAAAVAAEVGVRDERRIRALATASERLTPWSDSVTALEQIASLLPVVGLSNASRSALTRINAHAGLRWHQVLSAEDARAYKPHPDVYRLASANVGCSPDRLLMVAAHSWDLRGAQAIGMGTAYVRRSVGDPPSPTDDFDLYASSLSELAQLLRGARRVTVSDRRS